MKRPRTITREISHDRYGRRGTLTCDDKDWSIRIEPGDQRDEGEVIRSLSAALLVEAGEVARGWKP